MNKPKRFLGGALAVFCLVFGLRSAAAGGGGGEPATLSYLTGTFLQTLEKGIAARVSEGTKSTYDAALARADTLVKEHVAAGGEQTGWTVSETPQPRVLSGGDAVTLDEGGSLLWLAGAGTAGKGLVDATSGTEVPAGAAMAVGHRYLNGLEGTAVQITARSDKAQLAPAGRWTLTAGGQDCTHFYDLCRTDWYYDGVRWAMDQGFFGGVSATEFSPNGTVTRAMLTTVLYRLAGSPQATYRGSFSDVPAGQWYTDSVEWAAANGIAEGSGNGTFTPARAAGREEITVMIYRCAKYLGLDPSESASLDAFYDSDSVSPDARDAMAWAVGAGILNGSNGGLLPHENTTRAQVALILQRFQTWRGLA